MKVLITGDLHNNFGALNKLICKRKPDTIICCGDFGYWPDKPWSQPITSIKLQGAKQLLWCDGNHEDHWALRDRKTNELATNITYMPRGSVAELPDGRNILFMGGAESIDKAWRTEGETWFREETITQKDMIDLPDIKIDIIISHTCPTELVKHLTKYNSLKNLEPSNHALSLLLEHYKPDLWFFGHWHIYKEFKINNTKFYALSAEGFNDRWWIWLK